MNNRFQKKRDLKNQQYIQHYENMSIPAHQHIQMQSYLKHNIRLEAPAQCSRQDDTKRLEHNQGPDYPDPLKLHNDSRLHNSAPEQ
jgi:hypothetical protein